MFRPEKMSFVNISVLDENLIQVLDCITRLGIMHISDKKELPSESNLLKDIEISPIEDKLSELNGRINKLLSDFSIDVNYLPILNKNIQADVEIDPFHIADKIDTELQQIESDIESIIQKMDQLNSEVDKLNVDSRHLYLLESYGIELDTIKNMRFLFFTFGYIPVGYDHYGRLIDSLSRIPCVIIPGDVKGNRQEIIAVSLIRDREIVTNALEAAYFSKIELPKEYDGSIAKVLDDIEEKLWAKRDEMAELKSELAKLKQKWRNILLKLRTTIIANQTVSESIKRFGKTDSSYFISGWVPSKELNKLQKTLEKLNMRGLLMNATEPITAQESDHFRPKVPTKLVHPFFLRPFTGLVKTFDIPRYSAIDPTFFVAISFLAMFGIMFADVGHGSVLLILGVLASLIQIPQFKSIRSMFSFLACCGGASIVAGFLFGNMFGNEEILKPIWFSLEHMKPSHVNKMLALGVYFGIGMISLSVLLNISQSFRKRDYKEAFFGQWGLTSLMAYWVALYMLITKSPFSWKIIVIIALLLLPIMLKQPIYNLFKVKEKHHEENEHGEGIIESGFQIYEVVMAYLANTLSYIRIAAFDLSHAGLMMAAYALTKGLGGGGNIYLSLPSDIMANLFVIILEGLIVAIQCMRLEYYEFFSKFFAGEGVEYKPLKMS